MKVNALQLRRALCITLLLLNVAVITKVYAQDSVDTYEITAIANPSEGGRIIMGTEGEILLSEPFDEYTVGNKIAAEANTAGHEWWTTWSNSPGSNEDGTVANYNGTKCGHLTYDNDQVLLLGDEENGVYDLEFDILVPQGKNGYFNILHHFAGGNNTWAMQCYLHITDDGQNTIFTPGHGTVHAGSNNTADIPCVYDAWMHFRLHVDTDIDLAQYYYTAPGEDELLVCEWQWSLDSYGNNVVGRSLCAMDFYPPLNSATSEFYLDNFCLKKIGDETAPMFGITPSSVQATLGEDDFTNVPVTISNTGISVNNQGSVSITNTYEAGSTCNLTAIPNFGYTFTNWTKNGVEVSTNATFSFTVTENAVYEANFNCPSYTISTTANPAEGGTVSGGGVFNNGTNCTVMATANEGYIFINWTENGNIVSTDANYSFVVTENRTLVANFMEGNVCAITFNLYDTYGDGWNGNNLVVTDGNGISQQLTFSNGLSTTYTLYFVEGSHVTLGWISGSYIGECSFTVSYSNGTVIYHGTNLNSSFSYEFDVDCEGMPGISFDIMAVVNPEEGGTVTGIGEYNYGTTCTLTATANEGYTFMYWTENGQQISSNPTYSFTVTNDRSFVACFALPFSITATADPTEGGVVTGAGEYDYGTTCTLTAIANNDYAFIKWTKEGVIVSTDSVLSIVVYESAEYIANFAHSINHDENNIVYVKPNGSGLNDGSSWENATGNLNLALEYSGLQTDKPTIWVAAGTYYGDRISEHNAFTMVDGVNVYGGFVGNESADYDLSLRDFETNKTILDGQNVQRVVYIESANGTLDGFTIANGYASGSETSSRCGGGIYLSNANNFIVKECTIVNCTANYGGGGVDVRQSVLMDCVIDNCSAGQRGGGIMAYSSEIIRCYVRNCITENYGGGIDSDNSIVMDCVVDSCYAGQNGGGLEAYASTITAFSTINNCVIKNCNSGNYGGGIYAMRAVISDCNITANSSDGYGGGIYTSSYGNDTIRNCIIDSNTSESLGGGMCLYKGYAYNCLVVNNHGNSTGGLYLYSGSVNNCNIVNNTSNSVGGLYNYYTGTVNNTIIWGNKKNNEISNVDVNNFSFRYTYCAIEGVPSNENGNIELASDNDGMSNLNYVRFMDVANNNFQLMPNSVCVDAGNPNYSSPDTLDLAGNSRVYNSRIDMGCYEYNGIAYIEANISDEICQGEDYLQNGFEIIQPEVGENQYSITLPSSQIIDSIVNLTLTVHPVYFFEEDTTLCNTATFEWRGHTYTESGIYYDSLQTVYGCDSIYALSLEFFNTPLGEFASMTPTNNYPFTSLPITLNWDAVSGAEYYNLYLWNTGDPVPSTPFAGNIYNRSCYVSSLQNHQTYNWYVEAVNTCFSSTSSVRSFSLNIPPSMNVSTNNLAFGEVVLNDSVSMNMFVSGNALDDAITLQIIGEDASMFSFEQGSNWNGLTGGSLTVTFSPTAVQYNYTANLVITTGTLTQTVQLTGSLADMFVFNTYVTQDVFEMNSTIPIYGTVTDVNNNPMAGAEVEVKVKVMGTTRSLFATTGEDGHFSVEFVPAYSESGYYTVNSGRVGHNSTAVHDDFNIPGMNLVTNGWILWDVVQNETTTGSIVIRNRSQIPLTNIQVTATTLPEGCSFTFQPLSLQGMEEGVLEYSVTGSALTSGNNYEEVRLVATSAEGATMNFSAWYYCAEPRGILYAAPNNIITTMTKGNSKIVDVMLYNNGTGPTGNVYLDLPSVDWLSVVGNDTLPFIAVHDSAYFSLRLSANENTPLVQYTGNIAINCERGDGLSLPYTITAVSDSTGTLVVDVTDDYTYNGNGQHLAGATVTVKGYYSLQTVAIGLTGSDGTFTVEDIPEGYYRMSITAPQHAEYQATIQIEGGQTNVQDIYLQYQAITYSWNVVPTEIPDEYSFELVVVFETNVPIPVVTIEMPETFPELEDGETFVFDYIVTNHGLINSYDATLYPPTGHPLYDFTPLITEIDTLRAQETITIPCTMTRRNSQRSQKVEEALGGNRDNECPYMARTSIRSYYICGGERRPIYGYRLVNIGSYPCQTVVAIHEPSHEHKPNNNEPHHHEPIPPVTWQQHGCSDDSCQSEALDELNSCPPQNNNTPKLPPFQPGNRRNN